MNASHRRGHQQLVDSVLSRRFAEYIVTLLSEYVTSHHFEYELRPFLFVQIRYSKVK